MQVLTHFPLLKALGWALFNSLWQMAALWLLHSLLITVFRTTATARHRLALLFLGAGAAWTGLSFCTAWLLPGNEASFWLPFLSSARPGPGSFWQAGRGIMEEVLPYGSAIYLLVLGSLLFRYSSHYRHSRKLTRQGLSAMPPQFRTFVAFTADQLGIRTPVKAWLSSLIDVPLTLGVLKPVILLPAAMITQLTPQQVEAILVHELAHIKRMDYLLHLLVTILEGLFFFNPFARLLIRRLKKERENCCDDMVLQFKYDAHAYVSALLSLATRRQPLHKLVVAATGTGDRLLLQRAKRILLAQKGERLNPGTRPLLLLLFTGLITALALYHPLLKARKPAPATTVSAELLYRFAPATPNMIARTPMALATQKLRQSELYFSEPLRSGRATRPRQSQPAGNQTSARRNIAVARVRQLSIIPAGVEDIFFNTANDISLGSAEELTASAAITDDPDMVSVTTAGSRDYSLNMPVTVTSPLTSVQTLTPFVPGSSFSYQYTPGDSSQHEEQLLYLQQSAQLDVLAAVAKLQQHTAAELKALALLQKKASESVLLRHDIQSKQLQIQQEYNKKIETWQKKLFRTTHIKMIVYI